MATRRNQIPVILAFDVDLRWAPADLEAVLGEAEGVRAALSALGHETLMVPVSDLRVAEALCGFDPARYVVLNWIEDLPLVRHGDVVAAAALERAGYTFTGPPSRVLALGWDKPRVKRALERAGVPTPAWVLCREVADAARWLTFTAIVKPAYEHCSVGLSRHAVVFSIVEMLERVDYVTRCLRQPAIVEEFISGREFHVNVFGDRVLRVLPPAEMDFSAFPDVRDHLCTFDSKFSPGSPDYELTRVQVAANLGPEDRAQIETCVVGAFRAIGCRDYARMDVREAGGRYHVVDVNPNPDISSDTSMALSAASIGLSHGEVLSKVVALAARRHPVLRAMVRGSRATLVAARAGEAPP